MTDTTANLLLPEITAAQAQKHVTHNEALRALDVLIQLAVLDRDLSSPPGSPAEGQRWLVATSATGTWSGHSHQIAAWQDGAWEFYSPKIGWLAYVVDEGALIAWDGSAWVPALDMVGGATELQNMALLGLGTTADSTNPFAAKLNNALWTAKTVAEGGDGNLRYKLSKESSAKTLSLLFQDNYSGRAEIGLTGDDDFRFKVSADGSTWKEAIVIDKSSGQVSFPQGGSSSDLELTLAQLSLGVADALNSAQFVGSSGNRFADSFDALSYVDTAGATNLDSATAGVLKPSATSSSQISQGTGTAIGDATANGGLAAAFDGTTSQAYSACATGATANGHAYVGKNFSAAPKKIASVTAFPANGTTSSWWDYISGGTNNHTVTLYGKNGSAPASGTDGTSLGTTGSFADGSTASKSITSSDQTTAWDYVWIYITSTAGGDRPQTAEVQFFTPGATNNLTVASTALTAASAPASAKLVARVKEADSITLNTDLIASVSRNNGTNWTAFALTKKYTSNTISVYESSTLDISAQPSGTSMKWKIATANNKMVEIHDVYLYWA